MVPCPCPTKKFRKYSTCMFSLFPETSPQRTLTLFHSFRIAGYFSIVALGKFFDSLKWCLSCLAQNLFEGVVLYDYLITFSSEVRCIWQRKLDVGTALLFIVRYTSLFEAPTYIVFSMFSPLQYMSPAKAESVRLFSWTVINCLFVTHFMIQVLVDFFLTLWGSYLRPILQLCDSMVCRYCHLYLKWIINRECVLF